MGGQRSQEAKGGIAENANQIWAEAEAAMLLGRAPPALRAAAWSGLVLRAAAWSARAAVAPTAARGMRGVAAPAPAARRLATGVTTGPCTAGETEREIPAPDVVAIQAELGVAGPGIAEITAAAAAILERAGIPEARLSAEYVGNSRFGGLDLGN